MWTTRNATYIYIVNFCLDIVQPCSPRHRGDFEEKKRRAGFVLGPELARRGLLFNAVYISNPCVALSHLFVREGKSRVVGGRRGSPVQANGQEEEEEEEKRKK